MRHLLLPAIIIILSSANLSAQNSSTDSDLQTLVKRALNHSRELKMQQQEVEKAKIDRQKAWFAYLPK